MYFSDITQVLGEAMAGISHNAKNSNLPEFGDSVSSGSKALCGLTEAAAQVGLSMLAGRNPLPRPLIRARHLIRGRPCFRRGPGTTGPLNESVTGARRKRRAAERERGRGGVDVTILSVEAERSLCAAMRCDALRRKCVSRGAAYHSYFSVGFRCASAEARARTHTHTHARTHSRKIVSEAGIVCF